VHYCARRFFWFLRLYEGKTYVLFHLNNCTSSCIWHIQIGIYRRGNQKSFIEGQNIQWTKENGQRDIQSTKHHTEN